jgi:predicted permease
MSAVRRALARAGALLRGHGRADAELREEMEAHLAMVIDDNVRRGMPPAEARRQALIASGGLAQAASLVREQRGVPAIETFVADVRYAVRHCRRTPLATASMILVMTLGLGAAIVLFTVLTSLATMPPTGITRDETLVRIRGTVRLPGDTSDQARYLSWPEVQAYAERTELFEDVAAHADDIGVLWAAGPASASVSARLLYVTPNYLALLGVRPAIGREPIAGPDVMQLTASPTAMISHSLWMQQFGGDPGVVGRVVRVNGVPVQIVGVAPPRFAGSQGGSAPTLWLPLASYPLLQHRTSAAFVSVDSQFLSAFARLRAGRTASAAAPVAAGVASRLLRTGRRAVDSASRVRESADVVPMLASNAQAGGRADMLVSVGLASGLALLVLLVTCTNVSALLVGLAVARRQEIGVRLALGAARARIVRQLLTESVLISLVAAVIGLGVTAVGIQVATSALEDVPLAIDWRVVLGTAAAALATGILFGLSPALHATRVAVGEVLKSSARSVGQTRSRLHRVLVVAQVALTQPLLVGLGVVVTTMAADPNGTARSAVADRIVEVEVDTWTAPTSAAERAARIDAATARIAALPGVAAAMPMEMGTVTASLAVHPGDRVSGAADQTVITARLTAAPEGYFRAFGIPIVRGRDFEPGERAHTVEWDISRPIPYRAVVIGRDLARRLWGGADPIGRRLVIPRSDGAPVDGMVVVGLVDEAAERPDDATGRARVYVPYAPLNTGVIARTIGPALLMLDPVRRAVAAEAPRMPIVRAQSMAQRHAEQRRSVVRASAAAAAGGGLALLLSAIGLYAVVSFAVGQRSREIGIRTALGAQRGAIVRMFFLRGLALAAVGLAIGLPLSTVAMRAVATTFGFPLASSPLLGAGIGIAVLAVASVATWVPARRASTIDPVAALRAE